MSNGSTADLADAAHSQSRFSPAAFTRAHEAHSMHEVVDLLFFLNQVTAADSPLGVWQSLRELAAATGFTQQLILSANASDGPHDGAPLYPKIDGKAANAAEIKEHSAILLDALSGFDAPTTFADAKLEQMLHARGRAAISTPYGQLPADGLIVPVALSNGKNAVFLFTGAPSDVGWATRSILHIASITAFRHATQLEHRPASTARALSAREIECLNWLTRGKTDEEIGEILSISGRTVRFHVDNAKDKLGVVTRLQAVAKFVRRPNEAY